MLSQIIAMVLDDVLMTRYLIEKAKNGLTGVEIQDTNRGNAISNTSSTVLFEYN